MLADTARLAVELKLSQTPADFAGKVSRQFAAIDRAASQAGQNAGRGISGALNGINRSLGGFERNIGQAFTHLGQGLERASRNIQRLGLIAGGLAVGAGVAAVRWAGDFQASLNTINTIAHKTPEALGQIGDGLRKVARETGVSLDDLTDGYYDLLSAGVKAKDAQSVLNDAVKLGIGGLATTAQTVDLLTTAMNAYGLSAEGVTKATDQFALAVQDGKVTADEIAASFADIAPIARTYKVGIDQITASYAYLTAQGNKAPEVATMMQRAIISLISPTADLEKAQKKLHIVFSEEVAKKGLVPALQELRDYADKNKIPLIDLVGRVEAVKYILGTTGPNFAGFNSELGKMGKASGTAASQMAERQQGLNYQLNVLKANVRDAGITIGSALLPKLTPLVAKLNELVQGHQGDIAKFGTDLANAFEDVAKWVAKLDFESIGRNLKVAGQFAKGLIDAFLAAPPWLQQAVITGWGLNKLTGGAVGSIFGDLTKGLIGGIAGQLGKAFGGRGGTPANPMFVKDVGAPLGKGGGQAGQATGGFMGKVAVVGAIALSVGTIIELKGILDEVSRANRQQETDLTKQTTDFAKGASLADLQKNLQGIEQTEKELRDGLTPESIAYAMNIDGVRDSIEGQKALLRDQIAVLQSNGAASSADQKAAQQGMGALGNAIAAQNLGLNVAVNNMSDATRSAQLAGTTAIKGLHRPLDALHRDLLQAESLLRHATTPTQIAAAAAKAAASVAKGVGGSKGTEALLAELRKKREVVLSSGDKAALKSIDRSIDAVEQRLPGRQWAAAQLAEAKKIAGSGESTKDKVRDLTKLASEQLRQSPRLSAAVTARINALKADLHSTTSATTAAANRAAAAIRAKKLSVANSVQVNVSTFVSAAAIRHVTTTYNRYGTQIE